MATKFLKDHYYSTKPNEIKDGKDVDGKKVIVKDMRTKTFEDVLDIIAEDQNYSLFKYQKDSSENFVDVKDRQFTRTKLISFNDLKENRYISFDKTFKNSITRKDFIGDILKNRLVLQLVTAVSLIKEQQDDKDFLAIQFWGGINRDILLGNQTSFQTFKHPPRPSLNSPSSELMSKISILSFKIG